MKTVAQLLKHDFDKGSLRFYDSNGKLIYLENSNGYWSKSEYDANGNPIYYENSDGEIIDNRPKTSNSHIHNVTKRNWFQKQRIEYRYLMYMGAGILIGLMLPYVC